MNIAISFGHQNKNSSIWDDDKIQNTFFLYFLLDKIENVNVYLINFGYHVNSLTKKSREELGGIKLWNWLLVKDKVRFDTFIESGLKLTNDTVTEIKQKKIKLISFNNYNKYLMDVEDILFNPNTDENIFDDYDEVWSLENFQRMNKFYLELIYNTKVYNLPTIWDSHFIDKEIKNKIKNDNNYNYNYTINNKKNIVVFQKNENVNDICIYPLLIVEKAYKNNKDLFKNKINKLLLINSKKLVNNKKFISVVNKLDIYKDGYIVFKDNQKNIDTIPNETDIVVSHHWDNTVNNYLFDALYGGYPILHNTDILKNNGYYYPDFNIQLASEKLLYLIENHDKNSKKYKLKSQGIMNNYNINNGYIQNEYLNRLLDLKKNNNLI